MLVRHRRDPRGRGHWGRKHRSKISDGQSSEESQDEGYARLDVGVLLGFEGEDGLVEEDTLVLGSEHFHETFHEVL